MGAVGYVVYKRCVEGDRRKVKASSNEDKKKGGGARDLRFNPWNKLEPAVAQLFKGRHQLEDGRTVYSTPVHWWGEGAIRGPVEVEVWQPAKSRSDGRLARVHKVTPFDENHLPEASLDPFFLLWEDGDRVWASYRTVTEFHDPSWPKPFVQPILNSVATVPATQNIRGWFDARTHRGEHFDGN